MTGWVCDVFELQIFIHITGFKFMVIEKKNEINDAIVLDK